ncbi:hypothetical protein GYMLUDRAFT_246562 [Collybiopsis luxurians FD-317 M1]|uniref:Uncharacterized protein n=1 Tax=Collybiopsis luxurians FD-317 M1 TaxID=944289 RepID=A0A0D0B3R4_9AGAR|nr:hypothetical protein GYMLUDRAFT_246562 [Collybiopsis luxurians FD-317 M1]
METPNTSTPILSPLQPPNTPSSSLQHRSLFVHILNGAGCSDNNALGSGPSKCHCEDEDTTESAPKCLKTSHRNSGTITSASMSAAEDSVTFSHPLCHYDMARKQQLLDDIAHVKATAQDLGHKSSILWSKDTDDAALEALLNFKEILSTFA